MRSCGINNFMHFICGVIPYYFNVLVKILYLKTSQQQNSYEVKFTCPLR